jgi:hypothetical protein
MKSFWFFMFLSLFHENFFSNELYKLCNATFLKCIMNSVSLFCFKFFSSYIISNLLFIVVCYILLGGATHALHGSTSPPPLPRSASPPLNLRGLVFNFKTNFCCSFFFLLRIFFSRTKSFIDIDRY